MIPFVTRWMPVATYLAVFAALVVWTTLRGEEQPAALLIAVRDMAAGHLLEPGDVKAMPGAGAYLRRPVRKQEAIRPADIAVTPFTKYELRANFAPLALPIARSQIARGVLNATSKVRLCAAGKTAIGEAEVRFVSCLGSDEFCVAVVDVPADKASALLAELKTSNAVRVKAAGESCQ